MDGGGGGGGGGPGNCTATLRICNIFSLFMKCGGPSSLSGSAPATCQKVILETNLCIAASFRAFRGRYSFYVLFACR